MPILPQPMDNPDAMAERILDLERQKMQTKKSSLMGPVNPSPTILNPYSLELVGTGAGNTNDPVPMMPHAMSGDGSPHMGEIASIQGPQFALLDGSRPYTGHLLPTNADTYDIGSSDRVFRKGYFYEIAVTKITATNIAAAIMTGTLTTQHLLSSTTNTYDLGSVANVYRKGYFNEIASINGITAGSITLLGTSFTQTLLPNLANQYDIGSFTKPYRKGFISELSSVVLKEYTQMVMGGSFIVSKQSGATVGETLSSDTQVDFGQSMTPNDIVYFVANGNLEYMKVDTLVSGTKYNVIRNLDGTGADLWPAGTVYSVHGQTGDGWLDLSSYGQPTLSVFQQGATWDSGRELIRIGDLKDSWGFGTNVYGAVFGEYAVGKPHLLIEPDAIALRNYLVGGPVDVIRLTGAGSSFESMITCGIAGGISAAAGDIVININGISVTSKARGLTFYEKYTDPNPYEIGYLSSYQDGLNNGLRLFGGYNEIPITIINTVMEPGNWTVNKGTVSISNGLKFYPAWNSTYYYCAADLLGKFATDKNTRYRIKLNMAACKIAADQTSPYATIKYYWKDSLYGTRTNFATDTLVLGAVGVLTFDNYIHEYGTGTNLGHIPGTIEIDVYCKNSELHIMDAYLTKIIDASQISLTGNEIQLTALNGLTLANETNQEVSIVDGSIFLGKPNPDVATSHAINIYSYRRQNNFAAPDVQISTHILSADPWDAPYKGYLIISASQVLFNTSWSVGISSDLNVAKKLTADSLVVTGEIASATLKVAGAVTLNGLISGTGVSITPAANAVVKADAAGKISTGWLPTITLSDTTARTYNAGTAYKIGGAVAMSADSVTYLGTVHVKYGSEFYHTITGAFVISPGYWKASGTVIKTVVPLEQHGGNDITCSVYFEATDTNRRFTIEFSSAITVGTGGFVNIYLTRLH